jgi:hypothetical protein
MVGLARLHPDSAIDPIPLRQRKRAVLAEGLVGAADAGSSSGDHRHFVGNFHSATPLFFPAAFFVLFVYNSIIYYSLLM